MSRLAPSRLRQLARLVAVVLLCLGTPAVLDVIVDTASWLSGAGCCADDCDESGPPCSQHCVHCVCAGHNVTLPCAESIRGAVAVELHSVQTPATVRALSGHLEPPFRPPVS